MEKVEHIRDRHISSHDISKKLNIDHKNSFKPGEDWLQKKLDV